METIGKLHSIGVKALFDFGVDADAENPMTNIAQFLQGVRRSARSNELPMMI